MAYFAAILIGYLLGCSNMALYLSKAKGVDLRSGGSGNLGASNTVTMIGWSAGIITAIHDISKAILAVFLARFLFPDAEHIGLLAGVSSIYGHIFPFYLKFRGGKGLASYVGLMLALNWKFGLVVMVMIGVITLVTDFIVLGTTATVIVAPVYAFLALGLIPMLVLIPISLIMLWKHKDNYIRIYNCQELGLSKKRHGLFKK